MSERLPDAAEWSRITQYLDHALDLEATGREHYLAELERLQAVTGARVRELLNECEALNDSGFLEKSPITAFPRTPLTGQQAGAYTIEHLLGCGGMGEVWLASRHDGRFEGRCAIKVLDDSLARASFAERFLREGRLLARLVHPHIARLIDAGTLPDGRPYLALEFVDGERIDRYCQNHGLAIEARVRLFLDVIAAVAHAHAQLIIHRDLKPSNVLVTREGAIKLLDFGIAKLLSDEPAEDAPGATRTEEIAFTPEYAAPEQLAGGTPSTATDVYQLGLLLYVLLTERHPLPANINRADRIEALFGNDLPRASDLASDSVRPKLRGDLDAILAMALRGHRDARYLTAAALGEDLRRYLNREPVSARRGGALYHTRKFIRRHKAAVAGTALALASLCGMLVFAVGQAREAARQRDQARIEAKRADAQSRFLSLSMTEIGDAGKAVTPEQMLESAERMLESHYSNDPAFMVDMLIELSNHYTDLGNRQREYDALAKAEGIARRQHDSLALARVQCSRVDTDITVGHAAEAASHLAEGKAALARATNRTLGDEVDCMHAEGSLDALQNRFPDAISIIERAVMLLERHEPDHDSRYTSLLSHLTGLYGNVGDTRKSFESVHKHRLALEHNYGTDTQGLVGAMHNEACALRDFGEMQAAFVAETQTIRRASAGGATSGNQQVLSLVYGAMLNRLDRPQAALPWMERAISLAERAGDSFIGASAYVGRAVALHALHRDSEADAALDAADRAVAADPQALHYVAVLSAITRAQLLANRGELSDAWTRLEPALAEIRDRRAGLARLYNNALLTASRIEAAQGKLDQAASDARDTLQFAQSRARDVTQSADVGEATLVLAQITRQLNDRSGARALASRAAIALTNALGAGHSLTRAALTLARESESRVSARPTASSPMQPD
jgi:serine/threonine protein kinase